MCPCVCLLWGSAAYDDDTAGGVEVGALRPPPQPPKPTPAGSCSFFAHAAAPTTASRHAASFGRFISASARIFWFHFPSSIQSVAPHVCAVNMPRMSWGICRWTEIPQPHPTHFPRGDSEFSDHKCTRLQGCTRALSSTATSDPVVGVAYMESQLKKTARNFMGDSRPIWTAHSPRAGVPFGWRHSPEARCSALRPSGLGWVDVVMMS